MKVVIQCCSGKNKSAGSFSVSGRRVQFVAHPELVKKKKWSVAYFRPDDINPESCTSWRNYLLDYNRNDGAKNPDHLLPAMELYRPLRHHPEIYRCLAERVGKNNFFILSAGWGLVRSDFLLSDYDITFSKSKKVDPSKRRNLKRDIFCDFAQLTQRQLSGNETIYFLGGREYLPLYYKLTRDLRAEKVVYFAGLKPKKEPGFSRKRCRTRQRTNWHYKCATDFIAGRLTH